MYTEEQKQKYYDVKAIMELTDTLSVDTVIDFVNASKPRVSVSILSDISNFIKSFEDLLGDIDPGIKLTDFSHSD